MKKTNHLFFLAVMMLTLMAARFSYADTNVFGKSVCTNTGYLICDDFNGATMNTTLWRDVGAPPSVTVANSAITLADGSTANGISTVETLFNSSSFSYSIELKVSASGVNKFYGMLDTDNVWQGTYAFMPELDNPTAFFGTTIGAYTTPENWTILVNVSGTLWTAQKFIQNGTGTGQNYSGTSATLSQSLLWWMFSYQAGGSATMYYFSAWKGGLESAPYYTATTQIKNSSFNVTNYQDLISNSTAWSDGNNNYWINVSKNLLTFTFSLNTPANASCSLYNLNYSEMVAKNSNYKLATTMTTSHSYTLFDNLTLYNSSQCVYCAYYDGSLNATSGCLKTMYSDIKGPNIYLTSQQPADITSINLFGNPLRINYNITDMETSVSNEWLYYEINDSTGIRSDFINGTGTLLKFNLSTNNITGNNYTWTIDHNLIYPAKENLPELYFESNLHTGIDLTATNNYFKMRIFNISSTSPFTTLLYMVNSTTSTGTMQVYYCNSSYTTGTFPNTNCNQVSSATGSQFNFSEGHFSKYNIVSMPILNGKISNIRVSPTSYIVFVPTAGTWRFWTLNNDTSSSQTTSNGGNTWTSQTYTLDAHIHQMNTDTKICYYAGADDIYFNFNRSVSTCDNLDITHLPPTSPNVLSPTAQGYNSTININYTNSSVFILNDTQLAYYMISLYTNESVFIADLYNNSLNLSWVFNSTSTPEGKYRIRVTVFDNFSNSNFGQSPIFAIDRTKPVCSLLEISSTQENTTATISAHFDDNVGLNWVKLLTNATGNQTNTSVLETSYNAFGSVLLNFIANTSIYYGFNASDSAGNTESCINTILLTPAPQLEVFPINLDNCPSGLENILLFVFIFAVLMCFILIGILLRAYGVGILGAIGLLIWSLTLSRCTLFLGVVMIFISLIMILAMGLGFLGKH